MLDSNQRQILDKLSKPFGLYFHERQIPNQPNILELWCHAGCVAEFHLVHGEPCNLMRMRDAVKDLIVLLRANADGLERELDKEPPG